MFVFLDVLDVHILQSRVLCCERDVTTLSYILKVSYNLNFKREQSNINVRFLSFSVVVVGDFIDRHGPTLLLGMMTTVAVMGFIYLIYAPRKVNKHLTIRH